ncbi:MULTISPECIES: hypothetical protein [Sulfitobacter]|uniref:Uncharacterized protein n=1 Tax=Sulfitobacter profundi TaxID=2679961 RepID=A0ABW1Z450_9RHOB|nr:hypothetical protein [Sulfitobacter indolifex]
MTTTERDELDLRDAGHNPEETAHRTGMALPEVLALRCCDDEEEGAEFNALCDAWQGEMPSEVVIDNI